jgi:hypothetical protein
VLVGWERDWGTSTLLQCGGGGCVGWGSVPEEVLGEARNRGRGGVGWRCCRPGVVGMSGSSWRWVDVGCVSSWTKLGEGPGSRSVVVWRGW